MLPYSINPDGTYNYHSRGVFVPNVNIGRSGGFLEHGVTRSINTGRRMRRNHVIEDEKDIVFAKAFVMTLYQDEELTTEAFSWTQANYLKVDGENLDLDVTVFVNDSTEPEAENAPAPHKLVKPLEVVERSKDTLVLKTVPFTYPVVSIGFNVFVMYMTVYVSWKPPLPDYTEAINEDYPDEYDYYSDVMNASDTQTALQYPLYTYNELFIAQNQIVHAVEPLPSEYVLLETGIFSGVTEV